MKIIWMSDLHFAPAHAVSTGADPTDRIQLLLDKINQHHTDAAYCVISGDLVNDAEVEYYPLLKELLDQLPMPVLPLVGNHDVREAVLDTFALPVADGSPFVQYTVDTAEGRLICLDTHAVGESKGTICEERYDWLESVLTAAAPLPCYLFMHHPPAKLELGILDEIKLENSDKFINFLKHYDHVQHLFCGHVHRPVSASISGIPLTVMPSTRMQAPLPYPEWHWDSFVPTAEAPMFGIVHLQNGNVIVQYQQFDL